MASRARLLALLAAGFCCTAAGHDAGSASLFARLGGADKVHAIVDAAVAQWLMTTGADTSSAARNPQALKNSLVTEICARTGGGCRGGASSALPGALAGAAERRDLLEALRVAMRAQNVPLAARNELLEALAPASRDVARL
jgi:hypothetical protein